MQLSEKQKEMVADFLREQDESMGELPADSRVQILTQIKQRVREELLKVGKEVLSDGRVESVLERIHITVPETPLQSTIAKEPEPAQVDNAEESAKPDSPVALSDTKAVADQPNQEEVPATPVPEFPDNGRHWMGVCVVLSEEFGQPVSWIRGGFILLGCITGPIALALYLAILHFSRQKRPEDYPEINLTKVLSKIIRTLSISAGLYLISFGILFSAAYLYHRIIKQSANLGAWNELSATQPSLFTFLLLSLSLTAALSAMPLAHHWDKTLSIITSAGLAVFAVLLSLGISLTLTGYLLSAVENVL